MKKQIAVAVMIAFGGIAFAQPAGSGAKAGPAAGIKPAEPPPAPKPPTEVADMAKAMAGNWKCTGKTVTDPMKPANLTDIKGTYKATADLDKYWVKGEWTATMGKLKSRGMVYTTYDAAAKKWYRHTMDSMGMGGMATSPGLPAGVKEGKLTWEGESHGMGMMMKTRTTEEIAAKSQTMTSEVSVDGGKKWLTAMTMTCMK